MSSGGAKTGCQARDGPFGVPPCVAGPGDADTGTHSARGRHSTCAMAPKPMEYEITGGRRGDETLAQQPSRGSSRVRTPPYRNPGYKPSDDACPRTHRRNTAEPARRTPPVELERRPAARSGRIARDPARHIITGITRRQTQPKIPRGLRRMHTRLLHGDPEIGHGRDAQEHRPVEARQGERLHSAVSGRAAVARRLGRLRRLTIARRACARDSARTSEPYRPCSRFA